MHARDLNLFNYSRSRVLASLLKVKHTLYNKTDITGKWKYCLSASTEPRGGEELSITIDYGYGFEIQSFHLLVKLAVVRSFVLLLLQTSFEIFAHYLNVEIIS